MVIYKAFSYSKDFYNFKDISCSNKKMVSFDWEKWNETDAYYHFTVNIMKLGRSLEKDTHRIKMFYPDSH